MSPRINGTVQADGAEPCLQARCHMESHPDRRADVRPSSREGAPGACVGVTSLRDTSEPRRDVLTERSGASRGTRTAPVVDPPTAPRLPARQANPPARSSIRHDRGVVPPCYKLWMRPRFWLYPRCPGGLSRTAPRSVWEASRTVSVLLRPTRQRVGARACGRRKPRRSRAFTDGPCRDRTYDLGIKSPLLYQLS